jgi:hypothetical protein
VQEQAGRAVDGHVEVKRVVLAELEALQTVDGDHRWRGKSLHVLTMEEQAVASEPLELAIDGPRDWRGALDWIAGIDDPTMSERMRQCLQDGIYRLREF